MSISKNISVMIFVVIIASGARAQTEMSPSSAVTTFRLMGEISGGYSYKTTAAKQNLGSYSRGGIAGTVRLKWGSSNFLGVGIESGWLPVSSASNPSLPTEFGNLDVKTSLTAVPLLFLFSIQRIGIQFHSGIGYYNIHSVATVGGSTIESSEWDLGFLLSAGYALPIAEGYFIGAEIKWYSITEQQISVAAVQVRYIYRLFEL